VGRDFVNNTQFASRRGNGRVARSRCSMKKGIHPEYVTSKVHCACGNEFETRATAKVIKVDICSNCHPFYTGKQKFVDTAGRVERFQKKFGGEYFVKEKDKAKAGK
jgi:large subunit ribosomal protein L31